MTSNRLEVHELTAGYGSIPVLRGVDVTVNAGEIVAMVGRNGAGKTTTLQTLAGLRYGPVTGSVKIGDQEVVKSSPAGVVRSGLVLVPEGHRVFGSLDVQTNFRLGAYTRGRAERSNLGPPSERVLELFPALKEFLTKRAGDLSGGQQQMVAIGQALMAAPKVLLLDEPSSGLAPAIVDGIYEALGRLRAEGLAIMVVEQNLDRAVQSCDKVVVLDQGSVVLHGRCSTINYEEVAAVVRGIVVEKAARSVVNQAT